MAIIKRCDICGRDVSYTIGKILPIQKIENIIETQEGESTTISYKLGGYDVCPDCIKELDLDINEASWQFIQKKKEEQIEYEYIEVTDVSGEENPSEEGWYELINREYVLSEDIIYNSEKTYYIKQVKGE